MLQYDTMLYGSHTIASVYPIYLFIPVHTKPVSFILLLTSIQQVVHWTISRHWWSKVATPNIRYYICNRQLLTYFHRQADQFQTWRVDTYWADIFVRSCRHVVHDAVGMLPAPTDRTLCTPDTTQTHTAVSVSARLCADKPVTIHSLASVARSYWWAFSWDIHVFSFLCISLWREFHGDFRMDNTHVSKQVLK